MTTATITAIDATVPVTTGGMGDGWRDYSAAAEAYAEWLESEVTNWLESQYPDASITAYCPVLNQSGGGDASAIVTRSDGDDYPDDVVESLRSVAQDCWARWVSDAELTADLISE